MDFFDFLFGKKKEVKVEKSASSSVNDGKSKTANASTLHLDNNSIDPVEQYVKESVADLKKYTSLNTKDLGLGQRPERLQREASSHRRQVSRQRTGTHEHSRG